MTVGENIKEIRINNKYSIMKVRELTGLSKSTISDIENNKSNPTTATLQKLASAFKCDVSDFFDIEIKFANSKIDTDLIMEAPTIYNPIDFDKSDIINIPIVGVVRAGQPILATENVEGYQPTLKKSLCTDKDYFYLKVQGDSMNQEFDEGSLLLIEQISQLENGQIGVVLIDGLDATVKKVIQNENMITLIPMSNNPKHIPHMYDVVKDEIRIVGRVKEVVKKYY